MTGYYLKLFSHAFAPVTADTPLSISADCFLGLFFYQAEL